MGSSASQEVQSSYKVPGSIDMDLSPKDRSRGTLVTKQSTTSYDARKVQMDMLKRMFYKLDPAVIKANADVEYGQLKLAVKYVSSEQLLLVKVELVQSEKDQKSMITELIENEPKFTNVSGKNDDHVFNEIFSFKIPENCFGTVKLRCTVLSSDGFEQDEFLGEVYLDVFDLDCVDNIRTSWHDLCAQTDPSITGEISLHLGFKLPQSLIVTIDSARNIGKIKNHSHSPSLTVKAIIPGVPHVFQTTPVRAKDEFTWIETFTFPVHREELTNGHLVLVVSDAKEDNSYLGECHIPLDSIDLSRGYEGTFRLTDMRGSSVVRSRWSCSAITQELQEALHAHSMYMRPQFLFQPRPTDSKVVSVTVPKALVHSRMRVAKGVAVP